jgi:succinate dehydrogenase / fumarate reductase flavoprotein subunit
MTHTFDTLIIGAGLAGLRAAIEARASGSVAVLTKLYPTRSHSGAAQGGIGAAMGNEEPDSPDWHFYDTCKGSDYLADQDAAEIMCADAERTVIELEHLGVPFSRTRQGTIAQRRFGGHTREFGAAPVRRACYSADRTGHAVLHALYEQCMRMGVTFFPEFHVVEIAVEEGQCHGAVALEIATGELHAFAARSTLVASGGYGRVFKTTSNAYASTGDCLGLLHARGVPLEDMEFFQFHPTGLWGLGILITEGARGEGGVLLNRHGDRFMERYAPVIKDLAPRDMVSRAVMTEIREGRGVDGRDYVTLDLRGVGRAVLAERLPEISGFCRTYMGIDPSVAPIPVCPTAHYAMGGVPTDTDGRVLADETGAQVRGLYAAGECACVSVHGANRLGCNSLLDTVVFGRRAGRAMAREDGSAEPGGPALGRALDGARARIDRLRAGGRGSARRVSEIRGEYVGLMMEHCSVFRTEAGLNTLVGAIEPLMEEARLAGIEDTSARFNTELLEALELEGVMRVGRVIAHSALARTESRGAHARQDHPARDDARWLRHTFAFDHEGGVRLAYRPVTITRFEPKAREY